MQLLDMSPLSSCAQFRTINLEQYILCQLISKPKLFSRENALILSDGGEMTKRNALL